MESGPTAGGQTGDRDRYEARPTSRSRSRSASPPNGEHRDAASSRPQRKVACAPCAARKRKCDGNLPCSRCKAYAPQDCHYPGPKTEFRERRSKGSSCLACRSVKRACDGRRPACDRCLQRGTACVYEKAAATNESGLVRASRRVSGPRSGHLSDLLSDVTAMGTGPGVSGPIEPSVDPPPPTQQTLPSPQRLGSNLMPFGGGMLPQPHYGVLPFGSGIPQAPTVPLPTPLGQGHPGYPPASAVPLWGPMGMQPLPSPGWTVDPFGFSYFPTPGGSPGLAGSFSYNNMPHMETPHYGSGSFPPPSPGEYRSSEYRSPESAKLPPLSGIGGRPAAFSENVNSSNPTPDPFQFTGSASGIPFPSAVASNSGESAGMRTAGVEVTVNEEPTSIGSRDFGMEPIRLASSPIPSLPLDYASKLFPSVPPDLLPDPGHLLRALDSYFATTTHNMIHRPTFEARICRGEDLGRRSYRERFRKRLEELALPNPSSQALVPELRESDAVEPYMDPMLLVMVIWAGLRTAISADPNGMRDLPGIVNINAMEAWLAKEADEFAMWFGAVDNQAIALLRTEIGISFERAGMPVSPDSEASSNRSSSNWPFLPKLDYPFSNKVLTPVEKQYHRLLLAAYHSDAFDLARAMVIFPWTRFAIGETPRALSMVQTAARITGMLRMGDGFVPSASASDPPARWILREERLRLAAGVASASVLFAELRNSVVPAPMSPGANEVIVPALDERRLADLDLPVNDLDFEALPAAFVAFPDETKEFPHETKEPFSYEPFLVGRKRITAKQAAQWADLPRGCLDREVALNASFGGILELGPAAFLCMVSELIRRHTRLSHWLAQRKLEAYNLESRIDVDASLIAEAIHRRDTFIEALEDAEAHLPPSVRVAYEHGDSEAAKQLGIASFGDRHWTRFVAFIIWLHVLHVIVRSPRDYISVLQNVDNRWIMSSSFVIASSHAINVSRLFSTILKEANVWRIPAFLPVAALRSGFIHALVFRRMTNAGPRANDAMIRQLIGDVANSLDMLSLSGAYWVHTKAAHRVLANMVLNGVDPTPEELEALRGGRTGR